MAIYWIRGKRKSGKTTTAKELQKLMPNSINLDGDEMRASISEDLGFSDKDRLTNNIRIAKLAKLLESQGFPVIVSTICPYPKEVYHITGCKFINLNEQKTRSKENNNTN